MVIFYSYVKFPEGKDLDFPEQTLSLPKANDSINDKAIVLAILGH